MKTFKRFAFVLFTIGMCSCSGDDPVDYNAASGTGVRIKTATRQQWVDGQWQNTYRTTNQFEGNNMMMSSFVNEQWTAGQWANDERALYTLIDSEHASKQVYQDWTGGDWVNRNQNLFSYDSDWKPTEAESALWTDGAWVNSSKSTWQYGDDGYLIGMQGFSWNASTQSWGEAISHSVYTNDATGKPTVMETFIGTQSQPYTRTSFAYDGNGFLLSSTVEVRNTETGQFYVNSIITRTNRADGFPTGDQTITFNPDGSIMMQMRSLYEYY